MNFSDIKDKMRSVETLKNIPVFHKLSRKELMEIEILLHERVYEKGEVVFEEGDQGHGIFIVLSGKLRATPCSELLKAAQLEFGSGELVGELSLFEEAPRTATILAVERTVTMALFHDDLFLLLTKNKSIGVKVLVEIARTLSRRARRLLLGGKHVPSI